MLHDPVCGNPPCPLPMIKGPGPAACAIKLEQLGGHVYIAFSPAFGRYC
jgi:hypothetical protein